MTARNSGSSTVTTMCQGVQGRGLVTLNLIPAQLWSFSGTGANVFDVPRYVSRVRIIGLYSGRCENFIVWIAGRLVVNAILGTCSIADSRNYDGTHLISGSAGGVAEVKSASGINWTITEVR